MSLRGWLVVVVMCNKGIIISWGGVLGARDGVSWADFFFFFSTFFFVLYLRPVTLGYLSVTGLFFSSKGQLHGGSDLCRYEFIFHLYAGRSFFFFFFFFLACWIIFYLLDDCCIPGGERGGTKTALELCS